MQKIHIARRRKKIKSPASRHERGAFFIRRSVTKTGFAFFCGFVAKGTQKKGRLKTKLMEGNFESDQQEKAKAKPPEGSGKPLVCLLGVRRDSFLSLLKLNIA